jgi:peptidoglycan glycosyltransferase
VLATSVLNADGTYSRDYPLGTLASHIVGYYSQQYGSAGVENTMSSQLQGDSGFTSVADMIQHLANIDTPGDNVTLTINSKLQQTAQDALKGYDGAAIVLDAKTGAVLSEASTPTYNNNQVSALLKGDTSSVQGGSGKDSGSALINRATSALFPPGSTFKIVTLTAALESGQMTLDDIFKAPSTLDIGGAPITNFDHEDYGTPTLLHAFELSANTVFAQVADKIGANALVTMANTFGFGKNLGLDFSSTSSLMPDPSVMTEWETAWAGDGQPVGQHPGSPVGPQTNVLQMASVVSAFANGGTIMDPYVVDKVTGPKGQVVSTTTPQVFATTGLKQSTIDDVNKAMEGVVKRGTATACQIPGYTVRGKTGTAQTGDPKDTSWFVGYTTIGSKQVVVAVMLSQSQHGLAVSRAKTIFQEAISLYAKE